MTLFVADYRSPDAAIRFVDSLHAYGFGLLKNHPVSPQAVRDIYTHWAEFFASPLKQDWLYEPRTHDGYFPSTTHRVINPPVADRSQARISLPLFLYPRPEVVLSGRHTAGSYLQERLRELGFG